MPTIEKTTSLLRETALLNSMVRNSVCTLLLFAAMFQCSAQINCPLDINLSTSNILLLCQNNFDSSNEGINNVSLTKNFSDGTLDCPVTLNIIVEPDCSCDSTPPVFDNMPDSIADINCNSPFPPFQYLTATDLSDEPIVLECIDVTVSLSSNPSGGCEYEVLTEDYDINVLQSCYPIESLTHDLPNQNDTTLFGYTFPIGITSIVWTAVDSLGIVLIDTCYFTVIDDIAPDINCPSDLIVVEEQDGNNDGIYLVSSDSLDAMAFDICSNIASITNNYNNQSSLNGAEFGIGIYDIIWTAVDQAGNIANCNFALQVFDSNNIASKKSTETKRTVSNVTKTTISVDQNVKKRKSNSRFAGDDATITTSVDSFAVDVCGGYEVTYRWTATDSCGNSASVTETFMVLPDTIPPLMNCIDTVVVVLDLDGVADLNPLMFDAGSFDECNFMDLSINFNEVDCSHLGIHFEIVLTGTDECGNSNTCTSVLIVQDKFPPSITCAPDAIFNESDDGLLDCGMTINDNSLDPIFFQDNCDQSLSVEHDYSSTTSTTTLQGATFPLGITIVTWTVYDGQGFIATCEVYVTVIDNTDPTCVDQGIVDLFVDAGDIVTLTADLLPNSYIDTCAIQITFDPPSLDCTDAGIDTVYVTVMDMSGNSVICPVLFNVVAYEDVTCTLNQDTFYLNEDGEFQLDANAIVDISGGICGVQLVPTLDITFLTCNNISLDSTFINISVNGVFCSEEEIFVFDTISPILLCPQDITVSCDSMSIPFASLAEFMAEGGVADDNCPPLGNFSHIDRNVILSSGCQKAILDTYEIIDASGNSATCLHTTIVQDTIPPTITCVGPVFLTTNGQEQCSAIYPASAGDPTVTDNCEFAFLSHDYATAPSTTTLIGASFPVGLTFITFTAQDECGNMDSCFQVIVVDDVTPPVCDSLSLDIILYLNADGTAILTDQYILDNISVFDNCGIDSIYITLQQDSLFLCEDIGSPSDYSIVLIDASGNSVECFGTIEVQEGPDAVQCIPNDITINLDDNGIAEIMPIDIASGSFGSCGPVNSIISQSIFDCNDIGDNVVMIISSNGFTSDTCIATVTVMDEIGPICNAQDITISLFSDTILCLSPDDFIPVSCTPEILCIGVTVSLNPVDEDGDGVPDNEVAFVVVSDFVDTITNPCNTTLSLSFSPDSIQNLLSFDCSNLGMNIIEIYVFDEFGNSNSCTTILEVQDNNNEDICGGNDCIGMFIIDLDPTGLAEVPANSIVNNSPGPSTIYAFSPDQNDTIGIFDCGDLGFIAVEIWAITNGVPTLFCEVAVNVTDPHGFCPNTFGSGNTNTLLSKVPNTPIFYDNCEIDTIIFDPPKLDCSNIGNNTITITVIDVNGNQTQCSSIVTIQDSIAPVCVNQDTTIVLGPLECSSSVNYVLPDGIDPCGGTIFTTPDPNGLQPGDIFPIGSTVIDYVTSDEAGNSSMCQFTVNIIEFQTTAIACKDINLSLDENCEAIITPEMVLSGSDYGCLDSCEIFITDLDDNPIPNMLNGDHAGQTFKVKVCCGGNCCWSFVKVEDKLPPQIVCQDTVVSCLVLDDLDASEISSFPGVEIISDCSPATLILVSETIENVACDDTDIIANVTRTWKAVSESGIESDTCTQNITVQKLDLDEIVFPGNVKLDCTEAYLLDLEPTIVILGVPFIGNDTTLLYPTPSTACNLLTRYTDQVLVDTDCKKKVMRRWKVYQWHCSEEEVQEHIQLIEVIDQQAPIVEALDTLELSTSSYECEARFVLPTPNIADNCSDEFNITISNQFGVFGIEEMVTLPLGMSSVNYAIADQCGNISNITVMANVRDLTPPVAVCDQFEVISIGLYPSAKLPATAIDAGSYDDCSDVVLHIARMNSPIDGDTLIFRDYAEYYCEDAGQSIMTVLRVTDSQGNVNSCMMEVEVQDKIEGRLICPADVTIDCDTGINESNLSSQFGEPTILDNCPGNLVATDYLLGQLNACGSGQLYRVIRLEDGEGFVLDSCVQTIYVTPANPFSVDDIEWPEKEFVYEGCKDVDVPIDITGMPYINTDFCQLSGMRYEDQVFNFEIGGACQKIIRTWYVVDWCQSNDYGFLVEYTYEQFIKINNVIDPEIINLPQDSTFCSFDSGCQGLSIENYLNAGASDDCTLEEEILTSYIVYQQPYDIVIRFGSGLDANGYYEIGEYSVQFIVEDRCGNQVTETVHFAVENCTKPTPYCYSGLSSTLIAMDTSGNGQIDAELLMLTPHFFNAGSFHACGYELQLSFSADIEDTLRVFDCADIGEHEVQIWVTDPFGNQDFCETTIDVQDNDEFDFCEDGFVNPIGVVQGSIYTEMDDPLYESMVYIQGDIDLSNMTEESGGYAFTSLPVGSSYRVMPYNDENHLNGVSTLDIVKIQRHILGLEELDSPYKLIAADINNDNKLTASDLLALRKLILGVDTRFEDNTSWRFVDESYVFQDEANPLVESFPEEYYIQSFQEDMWIDFIAVKTGDVSDNAVASGVLKNGFAEARDDETILLTIQDRWVEVGEEVIIEVGIDQVHEYFGMQIEFGTNGLNIDRIRSAQVDLTNSDLSKRNDKLTISDTDEKGRLLSIEKPLLTIEGKAGVSGYLSDLISIASSRISAELYVGNSLDVSPLQIEWQDEILSDKPIVSVAQNVPNPWMTNTDIIVRASNDQNGTLSVFDMLGIQVYTRDILLNKGSNTIYLSATDLPESGIYIYELKIGNERIQKKMLKVK